MRCNDDDHTMQSCSSRAHADTGLMNKLTEKYGLQRTLISFTELEERAVYFSNGGRVFEGPLTEEAYKQTLKTSTEAEHLIINGTNNIQEITK